MVFCIVDIGDDAYLNVIYMGLIEIPSTLGAWVIVRTFRRKVVYYVFYPVAAIAMIGLIIFGDGETDVELHCFVEICDRKRATSFTAARSEHFAIR